MFTGVVAGHYSNALEATNNPTRRASGGTKVYMYISLAMCNMKNLIANWLPISLSLLFLLTITSLTLTGTGFLFFGRALQSAAAPTEIQTGQVGSVDIFD